MDTITKVRTRPLDKNFGAEILDVDLKHADNATLDSVVETFHLHGAILIRGQSMEPQDLMRFVSRFGEPENHTRQETTIPGFPKICLLSNRIVDGKPVGAHNDGIGWHTDMSYRAEPVMCTMLYAVQVPPEGSDTLLADCCKAWDTLPEERKAQLDGTIVHHSWHHLMTTRTYNRNENPPEEMLRANPDVYHPLVRTHPADGRKSLFLSSTTVKGASGLTQQESWDLMRELIDHATQDDCVFRHKWQVGDVLMWDNRCTLHTGTLFDDAKYIREMQRLWVKGDRPR